jgi:hypothetical protein
VYKASLEHVDFDNRPRDYKTVDLDYKIPEKDYKKAVWGHGKACRTINKMRVMLKTLRDRVQGLPGTC